MQISIEDHGGVKVVRVKEQKLTYPILPTFFTSVQKLVEEGARKILIELSTVSYIDSASIGCLMDIHRLLREKEGVLRLAGLQGRVETMISMTGVHKIIDIRRDEAGALSAFDEPRAKGKRDA